MAEKKIRTTPSELMGQDCWMDYCKLKGIDPYVVMKREMKISARIELTEQEAKKIGLKKSP